VLKRSVTKDPKGWLKPKIEFKVGVIHLADVRNFGDVLFPIVVGQEITKRLPKAQIKYISATGSKWGPLPNSIRIDQSDIDEFDLLILAGGCVVHREDEMLRNIYGLFGEESISNPTDLVFCWTNSKAKYKAWLSVGVPIFSDTPEKNPRNAIKASINSLDFVGVRGSNSIARLRELNVDGINFRATPDLGWIFPRLLSSNQGFAIVNESKIPDLSESDFIVIQTIWGIPELAIEQVCKWALKNSLKIVLLPLTRCWSDEERLREFRDYAISLGFQNTLLIDTSISDLSKLEILSKSKMYLGESLHGFVSAISHGIPSGVIAKFKFDKFDEILKDNGLEQFGKDNWDDCIELMQNLLEFDSFRLIQLTNKNAKKLDKEFNRISFGLIKKFISASKHFKLFKEFIN
jgi:hypothetical protein